MARSRRVLARATLVLLALVAAGCARDDEGGWRVFEGGDEYPRVAYDGPDGAWRADVTVEGRNMRAYYEAPIPAGETRTMRWEANIGVLVAIELRFPNGTSWRAETFECVGLEAENRTESASFAATMRGGRTWCEVTLTPRATVEAPRNGIALVWKFHPRTWTQPGDAPPVLTGGDDVRLRFLAS